MPLVPTSVGFQPGDAVAWASVLGSYAEQVRVPAASAVAVPEGVGLDVAAAVMLQGITAHYLALDTFPLQPGDRCLIHAGAGGVGLLLIQIAKLRRAEVFTTVGTPAKADLATQMGADHVIVYDGTDFGEAIEAIAGPRPLDVVYDGVGVSVFSRSSTSYAGGDDGHVRQRLRTGRPGRAARAESGRFAVPDPADDR